MMPAIEEVMLSVSNSLPASIAAKATLVLVLGLLGALAARRNRAAVRHAILASAFGVLLLLPVVLAVAPPLRVPVPIGAPVGTVFPALSDAIGKTSISAPAIGRLGRESQTSSNLSLPVLLAIVWVAGALVSILPMIAGLWRIRSLRQSGVPWIGGQSIICERIEVLLHEELPGPMTCGVLRPAIVLPLDAQIWKEEDLNRALVHELEHVRRRDWVSQCIARTVCAVYWFHPLVWIAWRQLALEAERACDDAVLRSSEATAYADQLVGLARRLSMAAKTPLLAMANRADLAIRVNAVLDNRQQRGRAGALSIALACIAAVLAATTSSIQMVAAPQAATATPEFDAVSVKLLDGNMTGSHSQSQRDPKRMTLRETTHSLIIRAYDITTGQLGGEPDWFKSSLYSIEAVSAAPASQDQMMSMLRSLLADRFQLKLRQEDRELPVYVLEVAAGGPKFKALKPGQVQKDAKEAPGTLARSFTTMKELMKALNNGGRLTQDRPVVDRTNLTGDYDIRLVTEIETETDRSGNRTAQIPNLLRDIQTQLGLRIVSRRVKMPYFVVEHAAVPAPN
jgi:uncharacterized protein (TIGR03435 family)